ncbi:reticulon-3 isoform X1 [Trachemys scripta elegans]|uniref:reticulon-3 isoform X1 n=1 Tax=Trachemys scripta elegans TaxID=31138 RepID=UPI0015537431|nr:reticulon-3 isoform X1 [Trachemys scripta elegans]
MADPATQSPYISSSAGGGPSEPGSTPIPAGGRDCKGTSSQSCADSFVSSSQPVSLFSTSQEGTASLSDKAASGILGSENQTPGLTAWADSSREIDSKPPPSNDVKELVVAVDSKRMDSFRGPSADSGIEATSIGSPGSEGSPFSIGAEPHSYSPVISTSSPEQTYVRGTIICLSEDGKAEQSRLKDQDFMDQNKRVTTGSESRFTFLTDQKQDAEQPLSKGVYSQSSTPSGGETALEKDSPESPFEVIIDKAAFDKEYKDSLISNSSDLSSNWVMHSERELLTDIPEDRVCEFQVKPRSGSSIPAGPGLSRQSSGTTAALEEVSKCVREMHSFTNELLNWDLIPKVEHSEKIAETSDLPAVPSKEFGGTPTQPAGNRTEACKAPSPHPVTVSVQQKDRAYTDLASPRFEKHVPLDKEAVKMKNASPTAVELKADGSWPSSGLAEITDADSSGESDDTVIEDVPVDLAYGNKKLVLQPTDSGVAPVEKLTFAPVTAGKTRDWITADNEEAPNKLHKHSREGQLPSQTPEDNQGFTDDFETIEAHPDVGGSPVAEAKYPKSSTLDLTSINMQHSGHWDPGLLGKPLKAGEILSISPTAAPLKDLKNMPNERVPLSLPLGNLKEQDHPDALSGENEADFMRECLKSKGNDSLEDLTDTFSEAETAALKTTAPGRAPHKDEVNRSDVKVDGDYAVQSITDDKGNFQKPLFSQRSPTVAQDFEQEQLTIKALKELGGKLDDEQTPTQSKISLPGGGRKAQDHDPSAAQKSPLEKRPLCIHQQTDMKPAPATAHISTDGEIPKEAVWDSVAGSPVEHALVRLLTGFSVHDLIFWRDVKKTGFVFGTSLIMLLSLAAFSVISVVSYLILALLSVTISFRVYKSVIQAVQKSEEGHPFKAYLDLDITLSSEAFHNYVNDAMVHVNRALKLIIRLFLVEDLVDSLKLAVVMWLMTYVGAVFNGITLLILGELLIFGIPVVYEKYKTQIDHYVGIIRDQTKSIIAKIQAKLPGMVKKKPE